MKLKDNNYYLESGSIQVYPCFNRNGVYDPEAILNSEYNMTRPKPIGTKDSYIYKKSSSNNNYSFEALVAGYFVRFTLTNEDINNLKNNYKKLFISLGDANVGSKKTTIIKSFLNTESTTYQLDTKIEPSDEDYYFTGICFSSASPSSYCLQIFDEKGNIEPTSSFHEVPEIRLTILDNTTTANNKHEKYFFKANLEADNYENIFNDNNVECIKIIFNEDFINNLNNKLPKCKYFVKDKYYYACRKSTNNDIFSLNTTDYLGDTNNIDRFSNINIKYVKATTKADASLEFYCYDISTKRLELLESIIPNEVDSSEKFKSKNCISIRRITNEVEGAGSIAVGNNVSAAYVNSQAFGNNTTAYNDNQLVFGKYNKDLDAGQAVEIVGWGSSSTPGNIRTLDTAGNETLAGNLTVSGNNFKVGTAASIIYENNKSKLGIDSIEASGQIKCQAFYATSDKRLKENITEFNCEKSILDLPVYKYDFINGDKNQIGCLAQDLKEICPEIVNEDKNGYLSIQENKLIYLLLNEVKELKKEIENLKNKN